MYSADRKTNSKALKEFAPKSDSVRNLIMIVDDEQDILDLFKDCLQMNGLKVKAFVDALKALAEIQLNHSLYSVIMTDIRMPQMSGIEFVERVRKIDDDIKVIFMTAFEIEKEKVREMDKAELLKKPISLENLVMTVNRVLDSYRQKIDI